MKKSYLMIATAATLLTACAQNDVFNDVDTTQETPITFNQSINKMTRAYISGIDALKTETGFLVYGYKSLDNFATKESPDIFAGKNVYWDNSVWKYDGLRFWDKNAKYNFYAVAPNNPTDGATYTIDGVPTSATFGKITISGATSAISTRSDDYLIDRDGAKGILGSAHTGSTNDPVDIDFHHIMAKVQFALKSTLTSGTITVTNLTMTGWNNGAGTFAQNLSYSGAPSNIVYDEWTISTAAAGNITLVGTGASDATKVLTCSSGATASALTDWYIMVPQQITYTAPGENVTEAGLTFTVTYTYNDGAAQNPYIETFTNQVAIVPSTQTWGTDSHMTYTLDIKPNEIKFDVESICGFDVDGGNQDVNVK